MATRSRLAGDVARQRVEFIDNSHSPLLLTRLPLNPRLQLELVAEPLNFRRQGLAWMASRLLVS